MKNCVYHVVYGIMVAIILIMIGSAAFRFEGPSIVEESFDESIDFSAGWLLDNGKTVDLSKIHEMSDLEVYKVFSVYHDVPTDVKEGQYLCFRSKNVFFSVYMDGKLIYEPYVPENRVYTKSPGTRWNYVPISVDDAGKQIEIRISKVYETGSSKIDNLYIAQPARAIMDVIEGKMVAFITCILTLFVGILLMVVDVPINMGSQKNHELLYLGLFSVSVAMWCLAETHLLQFYLGDSRMMQLVSCCSLMLISIPMTLYIDAAFGFRKRAVVAVMVAFSFLSFVAAMILHFTKVADVHETLHFSHVVLIVSASVLFYAIIRNAFVMGKNATRNAYRILRGVGLSSMSIATVIDIYRYYVGTSSDTAMFVRIGLLIFIICFGTSSLEKTINAVKLGVQTELVSQLAYRDGLTRIGNRTAFEEHLIELEEEKDNLSSVGIIMFDVNDLKYVNDSFGHQMGDDMLVVSAKLIEQAFGPIRSDCYRIGGDEFAVILFGDNVVERYERGAMNFRNLIEEYNANPGKDFRISIAHGFAQYNVEQQGKRLMTIMQQADLAMYENKKKIKESQKPPHEYYQTSVLCAEELL